MADEEKKSFWSTLPGIITAITGLITAIGGLIVVLNQTGIIGSANQASPNGGAVQPASIMSEEKLGDMPIEEVKEHQNDLDKRLKEMERKIAESEPDLSSDYPANQPADRVYLQGTWYAADGSSWFIKHMGNHIMMQETEPSFGITAIGEGSIAGEKVTLAITTAIGTYGTAQLQVQEDQGALAGEYYDQITGVTVPLYLTR